jgi:probable rRNA maturation factor
MPQLEMDILIEDQGWDVVDLDRIAVSVCTALSDQLGLDKPHEISVLACNDARIAALNAQFRDKPNATNVLSWPSEDLRPETPGALPTPPQMREIGDVALALETCLAEADGQNKSSNHHIAHLLVHGSLHLLGYDHETDADAALMEETEIKTLEKLGIESPY